jgi:DNA-binding HxlR family transcriptional regulator
MARKPDEGLTELERKIHAVILRAANESKDPTLPDVHRQVPGVTYNVIHAYITRLEAKEYVERVKIPGERAILKLLKNADGTEFVPALKGAA